MNEDRIALNGFSNAVPTESFFFTSLFLMVKTDCAVP